MREWLEQARVYARMALAGAALIVVGSFVLMNLRARVEPGIAIPGYGTIERPRLLSVLVVTAALSVVAWWLATTTARAVRAWRQRRRKRAAERALRELEAAKARAARVQTRGARPAGERAGAEKPASAAPRPDEGPTP